MNKFFKIIRRLYTRAVEVFNNIVIRPKLNDEQVLGKFYQLSTQYDQTFSLFSAIGALERGSNGYSWDSWSGTREVFLPSDRLINSLSEKEYSLGVFVFSKIGNTLS